MSIAFPSFLLFAASQVGTPGPANMALMTTGAAFGFRVAVPFVLGVVLGKQLLIWPIGFGLMELATQVPWLFLLLKYVSAAYIIWLAWKVARLRLSQGDAEGKAPGFLAGLIVHPLNPKAWAMITAAFTNFVGQEATPLQATATLAVGFLLCQLALHPLWALAGEAVAHHLAGKRAEVWLMRSLALLTVLSVLFVLIGGAS